MAKTSILTKYTNLHCTVITPTGQVADAEATAVTLPAHDGNLQILPQHAPLISNLGCGIMRYTDKMGQVCNILVDGGVIHVRDNNVMVITSDAILPKDVSLRKVEKMLAEAHSMPKVTTEEITQRQKAICRAQNLVHLTRM